MSRIVIISDTHSYHRKVELPDGDILINCGDITWRGELPILEDFCAWMGSQNFKRKITIFGNHELGFQSGYKRNLAISTVKNNGIIYLENSSVQIDGLVFYGSPFTPEFFNWEFNLPRGKALIENWKLIPNNTNVLITHGPPYGIFDSTQKDGCQGDRNLKRRIRQLKNLKLHCFGHFHLDGGKQVKIKDVHYANAAICTDSYSPDNAPIIIDI